MVRFSFTLRKTPAESVLIRCLLISGSQVRALVRPPKDSRISVACDEEPKARNELSFCVRHASDNDASRGSRSIRLGEHIFGQVAAGETDEQKLVIAGLTHLKSLERVVEASKP